MSYYNIAYRYFNIQEKNFGPFTFPDVFANEGYVDIFNNHYWRNNKNSNIQETPSVLLTEYTLRFGTTVANIAKAFSAASNVANYAIDSNKFIDPYSTLYYGDPTGFQYLLPYLIKDGDSIRGSTHNNWSKVKGLGDFLSNAEKSLDQGGGDISKLASEVIKGVKEAANVIESTVSGFGIEDTYKFSNTSRKRIKITFPLYNTFDQKSAFDNLSFVTLLGLQNLKVRTSWLTYIPPKIYSVYGYGIGNLYMAAAYISNYDIISIGTTRNLQDYGATNGFNSYGGVLIPEAYKVVIELTELVPESTNIMVGSFGGNKVGVVNQNPFDNIPTPPENQTQGGVGGSSGARLK